MVRMTIKFLAWTSGSSEQLCAKMRGSSWEARGIRHPCWTCWVQDPTRNPNGYVADHRLWVWGLQERSGWDMYIYWNQQWTVSKPTGIKKKSLKWVWREVWGLESWSELRLWRIFIKLLEIHGQLFCYKRQVISRNPAYKKCDCYLNFICSSFRLMVNGG